MIELQLAKSVLQGMALFVSPHSGGKEHNPNSALHVRYLDPSTLRLACTNGTQTAYLRLHVDSDQLTRFYWPEEEVERIVSIHLNGQALGAIAKMSRSVIISTELLSCTIRSDSDTDGTSMKVPRLTGRQITLWDDLEDVQTITQDDCVPRGQLVLNARLLGRIAKAAKLLGYANPEGLQLANIGRTYGVTVGSDCNFWVTMPAESVTPPKDAGLPPYWLVGDGTLLLDDALEALALHVEQEEDAAEEQASFDYNDAHAPATVEDEDEDEEEGDGLATTLDGPEDFDLNALPELAEEE